MTVRVRVPATESNAVAADGPGMGGDGRPRLDCGGDEILAGIREAGRPCVADQCDAVTRSERVQEALGGAALIAIVVGEATSLNGKMT